MTNSRTRYQNGLPGVHLQPTATKKVVKYGLAGLALIPFSFFFTHFYTHLGLQRPSGLAAYVIGICPNLFDVKHYDYSGPIRSGSAPGPTLGNEYGKTLPFTGPIGVAE